MIMAGSIIRVEVFGVERREEGERARDPRLKSTPKARLIVGTLMILIGHKNALAIASSVVCCCDRQGAGTTRLTSRASLVCTQMDCRNRL